MPELAYPFTQVFARFANESTVTVTVRVDHDGDAIDDADVIDAVKTVLNADTPTVLDANTYSVTITSA